MSRNNVNQERALITKHGGKRPYGAKVTFQVIHSASIGDLESATVLLDSGAIATIQPARSASWEGGRKFQVSLNGFPTATSAETEGLRLAQALLLLAISLNFGLRLVYHARVPAVVYERFRSEGTSVWGEGVTGWSASVVLDELTTAYRADLLDTTLTLSMELYCAALLEMNDRARTSLRPYLRSNPWPSKNRSELPYPPSWTPHSPTSTQPATSSRISVRRSAAELSNFAVSQCARPSFGCQIYGFLVVLTCESSLTMHMGFVVSCCMTEPWLTLTPISARRPTR